MWKVGDKVNIKHGQNSWSLASQTLIVDRYDIDGKTIWCRRKGGANEKYPYNAEDLEKLSWNPFVRIKRMFCRAFECPYK